MTLLNKEIIHIYLANCVPAVSDAGVNRVGRRKADL